MSRLSEREIARKLAERDELEPPAGLLEKIKSEIPPMIPAGTGVPEIDRRPSMPPRQRWLIAASLVAMAGAGLFALHVRMEVPPVEETARTAASLRQPAPPRVFFPPPPAVPPQRSFAQRLDVPDQAPAPKPVPPKEQDALKPLGSVRQGEEKVEGAAPGGVVGGLAGGEPASPPPAAAPASPAALSELEARSDKKEAAAEAPARDEQRRSSLIASGNENLPRSAAPAQEVAKPQAAARAKAVGADPGWKVPSPSIIDLKTDAGTASYDLARRSLAAGRLPDPAAIRVGEILNAFDTGDAPLVEGASTPFVHGPQYRLLRLNTSGISPVRVSFNSSTVVRYRLIGSGVSALYEIELRPGESRRDAVVAVLHLGTGATAVTLSQLASPWDKASPGFRLEALAAEFAEILKGSPGDLSEIARQAVAAGKNLPESAKATELAEMVEQVKGIREK